MTLQVNDILEVTCRAEFGGVEDVVNVYQWKYTGTAAIDDSVALADITQHMDLLYQGLAGFQTTDFLYRDITVRNLTQGTILGVVPWPSLTSGSAAPNNLAPGISGLINMATNVARVVLRKYIGGLSTAVMDADGTFGAALGSGLITFAGNLIAAFITGDRTYIYGYLSPKTLNFEVPTAGTVTDIPAYQRRRKQGRGV